MRLCSCSSALFLASLAAQARVVPADRATVEGFASHQYPFSYSEVRWQQIWDGGQIATTSAVIQGVEFRRDGGNATAHAARSWTYTVTAYDTLVSPASMTTTWSSNRGGSTGTVVRNGPVNVPAGVPTYPTPQAWSLPLPFQAPFAFTRANGHFMLEVEGNDAANQYMPWPIDAENLWRTARGDALRVSASACTGGSGERVALGLSDAATLVLGGTMTVTMTGTALPGYANWLGTSNHSYLGLQLPFDLALLGAAGCFLGADVVVQQAGSGPFPWPIPLLPSLENQVLFTQALGLAPGANPGGFVTSDVFQVRLGGPSTPLPRFQSVFRRSDLGLATGFISNASFLGAIARFTGTFN